MREDVYDCLIEYGFSHEDLKDFKETNEKMYFTSPLEINKNINFLNNKGFSKEEIFKIIRYCPFMLTVKNNRLEAFDKLYLEDVGFSNEELKELMLSNPNCYVVSLTTLNDIFAFIKKHNFDNKKLRSLLLKNPNILSLDLDEFKDLLNSME